MHLDQRGQPRPRRQRVEVPQLRIAQNRDNQQNCIGAPLDRLQNLPLSMMKSFRSRGRFTAPRICFRCSSDPWKNFSSVSTDRQLAPAASYSRAIRTGSKSGPITPAEGEAFLTSAIRATGLLLRFPQRAGKVPPSSPRFESGLQVGDRERALRLRCLTGARAPASCHSDAVIVLSPRKSAAEQLASFGADVRVLHQRLTHQDGLRAALRQPLDIGAGVDAAFGDQKRRRGACCVLRVA